MRTVRIGVGAGFSGDRIDPAVELARLGQLNYLVFECLAERTIALAQQVKQSNPDLGYDPMLEARMRAILPITHAQRVRIVTNMGAANPVAAAQKTVDVARELGLAGIKVAAVTGDDVLALVRDGDFMLQETGELVSSLKNRMVSANAYLGVAPILAALESGADVVITGRAADPALFMAPLVHEFGWALDDWHLLGQATVVGHLLECAGQITGGYFADPGLKDIPGLARLGFPFGEVDELGSVLITKVAGSGGAVTPATCKEQLLYEIHDPARYYQPDVVADFTQVRVRQTAPDQVRVDGGRGTAPTGMLKVSVGYLDGYVGEGQISYAGPGAVARGRLALDIVRERLALTGVQSGELRFDLIGLDALHGTKLAGAAQLLPYEVRVRVVGRTASLAEAVRIGNEVETLYTNGPAGGGGVTKHTREMLAVQSVLLPQSLVRTGFEILEA